MAIARPPHLVGLGASTPIGRTAWSSAAAVRAGINGFTEHPYMVDSVGERMRLAMAPWLDVGCAGVERLERLLWPAIDEALAPLPSAHGPIRLALALALPQMRPGLPSDIEAQLAAAAVRRFASRFTAVATFAVGHAGGALALDAARRKIADGSFDACLVAGVESYVCPETLEWLEENDQLHGAGSLNNAWGFVPGEAAGAVLLVSDDTQARLGLESLAQLLAVGTGFERNRIKTETVCIGEGLTAAFRTALASLPDDASVTDVVCDLNGEPYRADEYGFTALRTKEKFVSPSDFVAPADCWGDVSAASVPLGLMLAAIAGRKAYANGPLAFVWASSESGERGTALLSTPMAGST